jgi:hypothetical protein
MDLFACGELLDDWMIGFEFKATQEHGMKTRIMEKAFRIIYVGYY